MFDALCWVASVVTIALVMVDEWQNSGSDGGSTESSSVVVIGRLVHCSLSAYLHRTASSKLVPPIGDRHRERCAEVAVTQIVPSDPKVLLPIAMNLGFTVAGLVAMKNHHLLLSQSPSSSPLLPSDLMWFHGVFFLLNLFTLFAALVLRWDRLDSVKALEDVTAAKYHYKSL